MPSLFELSHIRPSSPTEWRWAVATISLTLFYFLFIVGMKIMSNSIITQYLERIAQNTRPYVLGSPLTYCKNCNGFGIAPTLEGWSYPENWGIWTEGKHAKLALQLPKDLPKRLQLVVRAHAIRDKLAQSVGIRVNDEKVGRWQFDNQEKVVRCLTISTEIAVRREPMYLSFHINRPLAPSSIGDFADDRLLGMGLMELEICAVDLEAGAAPKCPRE